MSILVPDVSCLVWNFLVWNMEKPAIAPIPDVRVLPECNLEFTQYNRHVIFLMQSTGRINICLKIYDKNSIFMWKVAL